jgi:hypothetical protein
MEENRRNFQKDITSQRFGAFSAIFLRVAEKSHFRAFSRVRPISDEISADNFVLVVNAREYKTHEQQPENQPREESSIVPPPLLCRGLLSVMAIHHV